MSLSASFSSLSTEPVSISNYIGGVFQPSSDASTLDSFNPATGKVWAKIPDSGRDDVQKAVQAAKDAFESWSSTHARVRSQLMLKIADIIESRLEAFASAESRDQGKPISLARTVDIPRCIHNFRFFANAILYHTDDSIVQSEPCTALNYVVHDPVGVCVLISPWNLPLYLLSFKIAPAMAAGNTIVAKPSEFTSVTAWLLAHVVQEAGVPPGVVNLVFGTGLKAGEPLVNHPDVRLVSFTGSTATGQKIGALCASQNKKMSLEMGGKNPCIVFPSVDLDEALPTIVRSCFANQGEICLCSSRLYIHSSIFPQFLSMFVHQSQSLKVGLPDHPETNLGALVSREHWDKVNSFVTMAQREGATVHCGLEEIEVGEECRGGYYFRPTVISDVSDASDLMQEEIFGPVVCAVPFEEESDVISRANGVKYGLSASIWSNDVKQVHRVARKLQAGTVWCNCWLVRELNMPFGGTKASGIGRESAKDSLEFFTEKKTVCVKLD